MADVQNSLDSSTWKLGLKGSVSCLLQEHLNMESYLDVPSNKKRPTLFSVFFYISQKNSAKANESSGS